MEQTQNRKKNRSGKIAALVFIAVLAAVIAVCLILFSREYPAMADAQTYETRFPGVTVRTEENACTVIAPADASKENGTAIVFYSGAMVSHEAYIPLLAPLAQQGYRCYLPHLPHNLAILGTDAAAPLIAGEPDIGTWFIGGHSLGALAACKFAVRHADAVRGVILLAGYPNTDMSGSGVAVLSVFGDADGVLNQRAYRRAIAEMPADFEEFVIPGANHAQFGDYGPQRRDNEAQLTGEEQRAETVGIILGWLERHANG